MAAEKDVTELKKQLKEMTAEFRAFRAKVAARAKKGTRADVSGQTDICLKEGGCKPCIAWTSI